MSIPAVLPSVQSVLDLFTTELANVRFGDVDSDALSKARVAVDTVAAEVLTAEAALADARSRLQEQQEILLQQVHRALAYARVYAGADPTLTARLDAITLPRPRRARAEGGPSTPALTAVTEGETRSTAKRRGRPRKSDPAEPAFSFVDATAE
jgi:hypothetical protein